MSELPERTCQADAEPRRSRWLVPALGSLMSRPSRLAPAIKPCGVLVAQAGRSRQLEVGQIARARSARVRSHGPMHPAITGSPW
jgi:hypothetical protein